MRQRKGSGTASRADFASRSPDERALHARRQQRRGHAGGEYLFRQSESAAMKLPPYDQSREGRYGGRAHLRREELLGPLAGHAGQRKSRARPEHGRQDMEHENRHEHDLHEAPPLRS